MEYVNLGRAGLRVSRIALGTMNFSKVTDESDSFRIMDHALDSGVNFLDTADLYGEPWGKGLTEQIIGRWLSQGGRRDRIVLATKVYGRMGPGPNDHGLSAYHIKRACEDSLKRLCTDHIDLYQMHHVDRDVPWEEIWQAFGQLIGEGKVSYVGSSNFAGWDIATACQVAFKRNLFGPVIEQGKYNLRVRAAEREVIPACRYYGLAFLPWGPLDQGLLAGVLGKPEMGRRGGDFIRKQVEPNRPQLERWEAFCRDFGAPPAEIAQAWLFSRRTVPTIPVVGPRTVEQLDSTLKALDLNLDEAALGVLDEIFPPAGTAPEYYAW